MYVIDLSDENEIGQIFMSEKEGNPCFVHQGGGGGLSNANGFLSQLVCCAWLIERDDGWTSWRDTKKRRGSGDEEEGAAEFVI